MSHTVVCAVQLHNSLIISVLGSSLHHAPPTPPPDAPGKPLRKRRRTVGGDVDDTSQSSRLKQWAVGVGKKERERIRALEMMSLMDQGIPRPELNEISCERGIQLVDEGRGQMPVPCSEVHLTVWCLDPAGTYLPVHLASVSRAPTLQHMSERVALTSSQHGLGPPMKSVASLMMVACEVGPIMTTCDKICSFYSRRN